jgi:hypothetical protein
MKLLFLAMLLLFQSLSLFKTTEKVFEDDIELENWFERDGLSSCILPKASSSSNLKAFKEITYVAENANEGSLENAWIEGNPDYGVGESIEFIYHNTMYENQIFEIDGVFILNGYYKTIQLWKENSRVKKFKLFINGELSGIIELIDIRNPQFVELPHITIKYIIETRIKFEIVDIFKGSKYKDTAVTSFKFTGSGCN